MILSDSTQSFYFNFLFISTEAPIISIAKFERYSKSKLEPVLNISALGRDMT